MLQASPQYAHMMIVITYDENGGWWDHVAPPKATSSGPDPHPAIIVSPYARRGVVDHTPYDTGSVQRLIARRFGLQPLPASRRATPPSRRTARPRWDLTTRSSSSRRGVRGDDVRGDDVRRASGAAEAGCATLHELCERTRARRAVAVVARTVPVAAAAVARAVPIAAAVAMTLARARAVARRPRRAASRRPCTRRAVAIRPRASRRAHAWLAGDLEGAIAALDAAGADPEALALLAARTRPPATRRAPGDLARSRERRGRRRRGHVRPAIGAAVSPDGALVAIETQLRTEDARCACTTCSRAAIATRCAVTERRRVDPKTHATVLLATVSGRVLRRPAIYDARTARCSADRRARAIRSPSTTAASCRSSWSATASRSSISRRARSCATSRAGDVRRDRWRRARRRTIAPARSCSDRESGATKLSRPQITRGRTSR